MTMRRLGCLLCVISMACCAQAQELKSTAFPELYNSEPETAGLLTPQEALDKLKLPDGFSATLFAAEPDVQNPIAASIDAQNRLWVAENYTYAERIQRFDLSLNDRVIVLEDTDGDGGSDRRTVFLDSVKMLTGITTGQGGVWLMCPPQLLFVPDADGDLVPDGPAEVRLDGFHVARENYHNFANGLSWGPDGWLYGRCGASCPGEMGLPGSPAAERVPIRGGIWRFHPQRQVVEALTHGTTNPWGHDWNSVGELLFINTVNGHLWHAVPGAHFVRPHTIDANPHIYDLIDMHADHWHFDTGEGWTKSRDGAANDFGGGHAHIGMMIYQGDVWPGSYRDRLLTVNMHGRRINVERLDSEGSGYVARHEPDFVLSSDTWFRGMDIVPCPDGNVLLIDWSDTGECHDSTGVHRMSGRIFKITYSNPSSLSSAKMNATKLTESTSLELANLQMGGNEWETRRARVLLTQRQLLGDDVHGAIAALRAGLAASAPQTRLRCLWALFQLQSTDSQLLENLLSDADPHVRSWAIKLLADSWQIDRSDGVQPQEEAVVNAGEIQLLLRQAERESSPIVRLTLASTLQRLPLAERSRLAKALLAYAEDADDHNIPLMVWYGLTALGKDRIQDLVDVLPACNWPSTRRLIVRRVAEQIETHPKSTERILEVALGRDLAFQLDIVEGLSVALAGRRQVAAPRGWTELSGKLSGKVDSEGKSSLQMLDVLFGDGRAVEDLMQIVADKSMAIEVRQSALRSLASVRDDRLQKLRLDLLGQRYLNTVAAEGLASSDDPKVGEELIKKFRSFAGLDRPRVVSILASRAPWAKSLLIAVEKGQIEREEISPFQARQLSNLNNDEVDALLVKNWGQVRESPAERQELISELKSQLSPTNIAQANKAAGRTLFNKNCASCHTMFGAGGKLGPDLTGAQRSNMDYLLENIVDPSAVVTNEFRATILVLDDGRVLTGLITAKTETSVTLATQNEVFQIPSEDILESKSSNASTMPDGLLGQLGKDEIRDLFGYLQSRQQIALDEVEADRP
jgi:putative membrane-bound dehydrogenase-like protein